MRNIESHHDVESNERSKNSSLVPLNELHLSVEKLSTSSAVSTEDEQMAEPILELSSSSRTGLLP